MTTVLLPPASFRFPLHVEVAPEVLSQCATAPHLLVALDYDGTLVPIAARPEDARLSSTKLNLLERLAQTPHVTVAIVSGRPLADLRALLPGQGLTYIGTHGLEICTAAGEVTSFLPVGAFSQILTRLQKQMGPHLTNVPGVFLEDKGQALALHYRLASSDIAARVIAQFLAVVRGYQGKGVALEVLHGKKVVEVHPVGISKGKAVEWLLRLSDSTTLPLYFGDDTTDESVFRALHRRGMTMLVADAPRHTAAHYYLRDPAEVWLFLARLLAARKAGD